MTFPDWSGEVEGQIWDTLLLADKVVPGVPTLEAKSPDPRDKQKGRGAKKAKTGHDGDPLVEFRAKTTLTTAEEATDFFENILPLLRKANKNGSAGPVTIGHPLAQFWNVASVTIGEIDTPSPDSATGWVVSWEMTEWVAEAKVAKAPKEEPEGTGGDYVSNPPPTLAERALKNAFG